MVCFPSYLNTEVLHELNLELDDVQGQPVRRQLGRVQPSYVLIPLEHGDVGVPEAGQEGGARDGGGAAAEQGHLLPLVGVRQGAGQRRRGHLRDAHLLEGLHREVLQAADVDGALLHRGEVAAANAEVGRGAYLGISYTYTINLYVDTKLCIKYDTTT